MTRLHWKRALLAALACALGLGTVSSAHAGKSLRVQSKPGMKMLYRMEAQNEISFSGIVMTENQTGDIEVEALGPDDEGNPRFAFRFANFEATLMRGNDLAEQNPRLDGVVIHVTLSPRGEQLDVLPQSNLEPERRKMVAQLADAFFPYLPEEDVDRDDRWTEERSEESETDDGVPTLQGETKYTLEGFDKRDGQECAKIFLEGEFSVHTPTPGGIFDGKAKAEGESFVALDGGHILSAKFTVETTGKVGNQEVSRVQDVEIKMRKKS